MKLISLILLTFLSMISLSFAASGDDSPFIALNPPIIVNIMDGKRIRHMQVMIELKIGNMDNTQKIALHKGAIRHELILLLSSQDSSTISSALGKEQLRKEALQSIQKILQELEGEPIIDALYFTNFIIQ